MGRKVKIQRGRLTIDIAYSLLFEVVEAMEPRTILVSDGLSEKCFFFPVGGLRLSSHGPRRGAEFYHVAKALGHDIDAMAASIGLSPKHPSLADKIYNKDLMTSKQFREISQRIAGDELRDFCRWTEASYEFIHGNPPPGLFLPGRKVTILSLGVKKLLNELIDEKDTWVPLVRALPDETQLRLTQPPAESQDKLNLPIKSYTTIQKAIMPYRRGGQSPAPGYQRLLSWIDSGLVIRRKPAPLKNHELEREIDEIVRVMGDFLDKLTAHIRLAENFEKLGRTEEPASLYKEVGNEYLRRDERDRAIEFLKRALRLMPEDLAVREKIYRLYAETKPAEALKMGLELAHALHENGFLRRAKALLDHMRKQRGNRYELLSLLFEISIEEGDRQEATKWGLELIKFLESKNRRDEVARIEERLRQLGLTDEVVTEEELELEALGRGVSRPWTWDRKIGVAVCFAIILLGMVWFGYDLRGRLSYVTWKTEARVLLARGDEDKAIERMGQAAQQFSLTSVGKLARAELEAMENHVNARRMTLWRNAHQRVLDLERSNDYKRAQAAWEELRELARTPVQDETITVIARRIEKLENEREALRHRIHQLAEEGAEAEAWALLRDASERFPGIETGVELTLNVESVPPGASVRYEGAEVGTTPLSFKITLGVWNTLQFSLPGYRKKTLATLDVDRGHLPTVFLEPHSLWSSSPRVRIARQPLSHDGKIFVVGENLGLAAIDPARSGRVEWRSWLRLGQEPTSGLHAHAGRLWIGTADGHLFGFDPDSGDLVDTHDLGAGPVSVSVIDGTLYACERSGILARLEGDQLVQTRAEGPLLGPLLGVGPLRVATSKRGFQLFSSELVEKGWWETPGEVPTAPCSTGWQLIYGTGRGELRCLDAAGNEVWKQPIESTPVRVVASAEAVGVQLAGGGVVWLDPSGSRTLSHLRERVNHLTGDAERFYASTDRYVYVCDVRGKVVHRFAHRAAGAAVFNGEAVVVGNAEGIVYAFRSW